MNAAQAYAEATRLSETGMSNSKIAKALARMGYISSKTGKPLRPASVSMMVARMREGYTPTTRVTKKFASRAGLYLPRKARTTTTTPMAAKAVETLTEIAAEQTLKELSAQAFLGAKAALEALHSYHLTVATNLRILLDAVK